MLRIAKSWHLAILCCIFAPAMGCWLVRQDPARSPATLPLAQTRAQHQEGVGPRTVLQGEIRGVISGVLGREDKRYQIKRGPRDLQVTIAESHSVTRFTSRGLAISTRNGSERFQMVAVGHSQLKAVHEVAPQAVANRVEYLRGNLKEWYVNGPAGLEQGFTLSASPDSTPNSPSRTPLTIAIALSGGLHASLDSDRKGLALTNSRGEVELRYAGLVAQDFDGRELRSWMEANSAQLFLRVDDSSARYPIKIDPFILSGMLTASDGNTGFEVGAAVAISSGGVIAVSARSAPVGSHAMQGKAYVFLQPVSGWASETEAAQLLAVNSAANDRVGHSICIDDNGKVVVVSTEDAGGGKGSAFVFVEPTGGWSGTINESFVLAPSNGSLGFHFGRSVAIADSLDVVVVGAENTTVGTNAGQGEAYLFSEPSGGWGNNGGTIQTRNENARLVASDGATLDHFGRSVSISGSASEAIVVGANGAQVGANEQQGKAYVFLQPLAGWTSTTLGTLHESSELTASDGKASDGLGSAVSFDRAGDIIAVGAGDATVGANADQGKAYIFHIPAGGWASTTPLHESATLLASDGAEGATFGDAISAAGQDGSRVVVGAREATVGGNSQQGAAYEFDEPAGGWSGMLNESEKFVASNGKANDNFGESVSINTTNDIIVVGAPAAGATDAGEVYVFNGGTPCTVTLSPSTFDFGTIQKGTASPAKTFTLMNDCATALNNISVSTSGANQGDFAPASTCGTSLAAHAMCNINVIFTPSTSAQEDAALNVSDSDASSPQTATLTGKGEEAAGDFTLTSTSAAPPTSAGSTNSATVAAGSSATYVFTLTSVNGFNSSVSLAPAFIGTLPKFTSTSFDHMSVTPTTNGVQATLTVTTRSRSRTHSDTPSMGQPNASPNSPPNPQLNGRTGIILGACLPGLLILAVLFGRRVPRAKLIATAICFGVVIVVVVGSACDGCNGIHASRGTGTAAGTYTIRVTGTSTTGTPITHMADVTLVVQ